MSLANKFKEVFLLHQQEPKNRRLNPRAELTTSATWGILVLNPAARKLMGLTSHDRVLVFDIKKDATTTQDRFFITKGFMCHGRSFGSKINLNGSFMDAVFYNLMIVNDFAIDTCGRNELVDKSLAILRNTGKRKDVITATKKAIAEIKPYVETAADRSIISQFPIAPDLPAQTIFSITNIDYIDNSIIE